MKTINDSLRCLMKQQVNNEICDYLSGLLARMKFSEEDTENIKKYIERKE